MTDFAVGGLPSLQKASSVNTPKILQEVKETTDVVKGYDAEVKPSLFIEIMIHRGEGR